MRNLQPTLQIGGNRAFCIRRHIQDRGRDTPVLLVAGVPKCRLLERNTVEAIRNLGIQAEVEKITDIDKIMDMGVMMKPALAIDGKVKSIGKVLSRDEAALFIRGGK